jgi:hypothetical protein
MPRLASCLLPLVAAVTTAAAAVPAPALAEGLGGFSVRPARFDPGDPLTRAYFKHTSQPGSKFGGAVLVTNTRDQPIDLRVYGVDGLTGTTTGTVFANREQRVRETGRWLVLEHHDVTVPPHGKKLLGFGVHVPPDARPGDHVAGVAVEDAHPVTNGKKFAITEIIRAVVGVKVTVTGPATTGMRLDSAALKAVPGTKVSSVVLGIRNTGATLCKPQVRVTLAGAMGRKTVSRKLDTVLPGDRVPYPMVWPQALASGDYTVAARATGCGAATGLSAKASLKSALTSPGAIDSAQAQQAPSAQGKLPPTVAIVGVGFAGVMTGVGAGAVRRRIRLRKASA